MRQTVAISLPPEVSRRLDAFAQGEGRNRSEVVSEAVRRYLAGREFQRLRDVVRPYAEAVGIVTDDDVFERLR